MFGDVYSIFVVQKKVLSGQRRPRNDKMLFKGGRLGVLQQAFGILQGLAWQKRWC